MPTTLIKNAAWVIAWDETAGRQSYRRNVELAFTDDRIVHLGKGFAGPAERVIDGAGLMVMPGLIDIHSHPHHEPLYRGIREEHGVANMHMTGLYERGQAFSAPDDEARAAGAEFAYCELLLSGVTSLVDISAPFDGWIELFAKSGMRGFLAPGYASARWFLENDLGPSYDWDEPRGRAGFGKALQVIDEAGKHPCGRLSGVVSPMQIDTCTEDLLRDSRDAARERGLPFTVHCSQSVSEVREMIGRHRMTPIQWADKLGLLGRGTILGHALYLDTHSWVRWHSRRDLALLGDSGTAVAHCPTPFARYGHVMEDFGAYRHAGAVMGLGTDCSPHNLVEEMRKASVLARIAARDIHAVDVADFLEAATIGGATALLRDDLGRLAPGKKADLVLVDLACPQMQPARDPLRSFVYHAADRAVRDVFVDGIQVVANRKVLTLDQADAAIRLAAAQQRMESAAPQRDYLRRRAEEITPLSLPVVG
ncbi:MAG TPA: amidohydrolase family protein [Stellaceae bacterium]|jgi:cytosine/adenosine deaminase-related metal-dependent hydrolase|nr:amidohydrolase family protein [Stellaceae bacterium]